MHNYPHLFCKCAVALFAAAALLLLSSPLDAQVDLGLAPMRLDLPVVPGKTYSGALALNNAGMVKARVRVELLDLYVDQDTTPQFVPNAPSEAAYTCRSWLSVNPMELEVDPRSQVSVRYSVRVPPGASEQSYHCAIGFRTLPTVNDVTGTLMRTAVRMIAVIYPVVGKPVVSGVIKELKLEEVPGSGGGLWRVVVVMENSGVMAYRPSGAVDVTDATGKVQESLKLTSFPVLPKRLQRFLLPLKDSLPPGPYTLRAHIDVGSEIQAASSLVSVAAPAPAVRAPDAAVK